MSLHKRLFYDKNERQKIIDHIITKNLYFELRGRRVWQEMEKLQICPGRTWHSMKQQFQSNIINSLHSLNINKNERNRILDCYHKRYLYSPQKRKKLDSNSSDEGEKQHNTHKRSKVQTSDEENDITKSPEKNNACNRNINNSHDISNIQYMENTRTSVNKEMLQKSSTNLSHMDDKDENSSRMDLNSSLSEPYSEQEDKNIINYIKENMNWTELEYSDDIFENCHQKVLLKRATTSIKERFLNVILPNLYQYNIVNVEEIPLFYDRLGIDIPPELEQILLDFMENNESLSSENTNNYTGETNDILKSSLDQSRYNTGAESIVLNNIEENINVNNSEKTTQKKNNNKNSRTSPINQDVCLTNELQKENSSFNNHQSDNSKSKNTPKNNNSSVNFNTTCHSEHYQVIEKIDAGVQTDEKNFKFLAKFLAGQLCLTINNEEHVFIADTENNKYNIINVLKEQHDIKNNNIHIISKKSYNDLKRLKKVNELLEQKILNLKNCTINPTQLQLLSVDLNQFETLRLIYPCSDNESVRLPVNLKPPDVEQICECPTEVQPNTRRNTKTKFQKPNVNKVSNINAVTSTDCTADQLYEIIDNSDHVDAEAELDFSSGHSSPIIFRRNRFQIVDVNNLLSKEIELCDATTSERNIVINKHAVNTKPEILSSNGAVLNHYLNDPLSSSNIPDLSGHTYCTAQQSNFLDIKEELVAIDELCYKDNDSPFSIRLNEMKNINNVQSPLSVQPNEERNSEKRDDRPNEKLYTEYKIEDEDSDSSLLSNSPVNEMIDEDLVLYVFNKESNVEKLNSERQINEDNKVPFIISYKSSENLISCKNSSQMIEDDEQLLNARPLETQIKNEDMSQINNVPNMKEVVKSNSYTHNLPNVCKFQSKIKTYKNNILLSEKLKKNLEKNIESPQFMHEPACSTANITSQNKRIDLDDDTFVNDVTLPLNFEADNSEINSSELPLSEIRLSRNTEVKKLSDLYHSELTMSIRKFYIVKIKQNEAVETTKHSHE